MFLKQDTAITGRSGDVLELLHTFLTIENPRQKWTYNRIPPMSIAYALAEVVWIMNGENRSDIINFWNPQLSKYAGNGTVYYGAYGKRMRSYFGFDQLERAYHVLQSVPESRQVVIQIYDTRTDHPFDDGQPRDEDIPCNVCSLLKVRRGKIEWSQIMRSNDVLLGLPYNFVQFTCLQEILAGWLELEVGSYNHYSDSLHLYMRNVDSIGIEEGSEIENQDSLHLNREESEKIFKEIYGRMKCLASNVLSENEIFSLANLESQYQPYNNIMLIIAAYVAKKNHEDELVAELIEKCTNETYVTIWNQWVRK